MTSDIEQQVGKTRATIERILAGQATQQGSAYNQAIRDCLIVLAEAVQQVERTISRKIALGIERSKVDLG